MEVQLLFLGIIRKRTEERLFAENGKRSRTNTKKIAQTKLERYGNSGYTNIEQTRKTMLDRYGVEYTLQNKKLKDKVESTKQERYGDRYFTNKEKAKKTCLERYGVSNVYQADFVRSKIDYDKARETKLKNGTMNSSYQEDRMYDILCQLYGTDNIVRQYTDERYPYACDFYIRSLDLFIESQGHWSHGGHPYSNDDEDDVKKKLIIEEKAKSSKFFKKMLEVWCIKDVEKREIAMKNKIKYVEFFRS